MSLGRRLQTTLWRRTMARVRMRAAVRLAAVTRGRLGAVSGQGREGAQLSPEMKIGLFHRAGRQILVWRSMEASEPELQ